MHAPHLERQRYAARHSTRITMQRLLFLIGILAIALLAPLPMHAQSEQTTLYAKVKALVEEEIIADKAELSLERFAVGVYHDQPAQTRVGEDMTPFTLQKQEDALYSLQGDMPHMCGSTDTQNTYSMCALAQNSVKSIIMRNAWHRQLGRELQMIASGYEAGIDGYPGKPVDLIAKLTGITHLWRSGSDIFSEPFTEELTRARPWPEGHEEAIEKKANDIITVLKDLRHTWTPEGHVAASATVAGGDEESMQEDRDEMTAAVWRYRHGVQYVIDHEGACADASEVPDFPEDVWLRHRWCDLEDALLALQVLIQKDSVEKGTDEHIIYPAYIDKRSNIYLWMREDDIGLQWLIPIEPVQVPLYHPAYGECLESGSSPFDCYDAYSEDMFVRGGKYPRKIYGGISPGLTSEQLGSSEEHSDEVLSDKDDENAGAVVPEPKEGEGICSHPFSKRGYLCRRIEYEACDLTQRQENTLQQSGTGGIVLTRCEPERFKDDISRSVSGNNICTIGGWREDAPGGQAEDLPEQQADMLPGACASCAIDVHCSEDPCKNGLETFTSPLRQNGVVDICIPESPKTKGTSLYLLAHEIVHAQQSCAESNLQTLERIGQADGGRQDPAACCAAERPAYFVQCKLMALDGVLDKAGVTIDQCASAYANFACASADTNPDDENYVCTNDGIDPALVEKAINDGIKELTADGTLDAPETCSDALSDPRIQSLYNSMPLACKPGCEAQYQNTIGNNLCYAGQCIEEMHEWSVALPGRMALSTTDEGFPWNACELPDPNLGRFEVPPALTAPKLPPYRPERIVQLLDQELCQINGLPARTPPVLCGYDPIKRLNLPPVSLLQTASDIGLQLQQYEATGLGIQYGASGIGARIAGDMFTQYLDAAGRQFTDLLSVMGHMFQNVGNLKFPDAMCPRTTNGDFTCEDLNPTLQ